VKLIVALTDVLRTVQRHRRQSPTRRGHAVLVPLSVGFAAYVVLHPAINGVLRLFAQRKTSI